MEKSHSLDEREEAGGQEARKAERPNAEGAPRADRAIFHKLKSVWRAARIPRSGRRAGILWVALARSSLSSSFLFWALWLDRSGSQSESGRAGVPPGKQLTSLSHFHYRLKHIRYYYTRSVTIFKHIGILGVCGVHSMLHVYRRVRALPRISRYCISQKKKRRTTLLKIFYYMIFFYVFLPPYILTWLLQISHYYDDKCNMTDQSVDSLLFNLL